MITINICDTGKYLNNPNKLGKFIMHDIISYMYKFTISYGLLILGLSVFIRYGNIAYYDIGLLLSIHLFIITVAFPIYTTYNMVKGRILSQLPLLFSTGFELRMSDDVEDLDDILSKIDLRLMKAMPLIPIWLHIIFGVALLVFMSIEFWPAILVLIVLNATYNVYTVNIIVIRNKIAIAVKKIKEENGRI